MQSTKYIYWQDKGQWLGYLQDYPDYWTQGKSFKDLQSNLRDLYRDLTSGEIPAVRRNLRGRNLRGHSGFLVARRESWSVEIHNVPVIPSQ